MTWCFLMAYLLLSNRLSTFQPCYQPLPTDFIESLLTPITTATTTTTTTTATTTTKPIPIPTPTPPTIKRYVRLVVGVLSKLSAMSRRDAIRATWFQVCRENRDHVVCTFFTDSFNETSMQQSMYANEKMINDDLVYMPIKGGLNFGMRLVFMLKHYTKQFDFDFFLRVDDDYFVCLDRLINELPFRVQNGPLVWGHLHCQKGRDKNGVVWIDEGFMILTKDFILESLGKLNSSLKCHAYGDQTVSLWVQESDLEVRLFSDQRVVHEVTSSVIDKYLKSGLCHRHIALHGTYPPSMYKYHNLLQQDNNNTEIQKNFTVPAIPHIDEVCQYGMRFDWQNFYSPIKPVPCKENPSWNESFTGREENRLPRGKSLLRRAYRIWDFLGFLGIFFGILGIFLIFFWNFVGSLGIFWDFFF